MAELTDTQDGAIGRLSDDEQEALMFALAAPDPDRAPITEIQLLHVVATCERVVREHVAAALDEIETVVAAQREAFLPSSDLDPAWIAGWHSAVDHVSHAVRDYRQEQDR